MKRAALIAMLITGALMLQGCITAAVIGAGFDYYNVVNCKE